ncbi:MAG TPA: ATP-binding SpoIIE family protein phosphatase [Acidimicrobiales bacterium]|jgi:serine phosphatase RsbU (regulator of sigma subunit)/anti-sigma regulatory factor (Ser/Thr protein kinase)|nr:ATP-binding SpoIIE family protein phosphatase [Acidimicrobiales bacterium]
MSDRIETHYPNEIKSVSAARHAVLDWLSAADLDELAVAAALVVTELASNAVLHTGGPVTVAVDRSASGARVTVSDTSPLMPVVPAASLASMTGRGLLLVRNLADDFGFTRTPSGKDVWAEFRSAPGATGTHDVVLQPWSDDLDADRADGIPRHRIELGDVPTDLLLEAKAHVDNLVREFVLAASGAEAGTTGAVPPHLAQLIEAVVHRFAEARTSIKRQALEAARLGLDHTRLRLDLPADAAQAGLEYLHALDEIDSYCRAARLLTLETPPKHRVFRRWYIGELVDQLLRAQSGQPPQAGQSFENRLLEEIDAVATAEATAGRAARLYSAVAALSGALSPESVAEAVLNEGAAALGATGGGLVLSTGGDQLAVPGTVGYDQRVVDILRAESPEANLPAAVALRTGEAVWLESREERDTRFPELAGMERATVSMCAVPLQIGTRRLGALRFSFSKPRLFGEGERRFVMALAAQTAQALDRAKLYRDRVDLARRLQLGLLPPELPEIRHVDLAAVYHPFGDGLDVGGDFYDVWRWHDDHWFFAIGDVCGTGPEAAGMTAVVRDSLRALTRLEPDLTEAMLHLNEILVSDAIRHSERFCTVILGSIEASPAGIRVDMATGGHPGPALRKADGSRSVIPTNGSLLGVLPSIHVVTNEVRLNHGDSLVLYTDGVTEARDGAGLFEIDGLLGSLGRAPAGAAAIATAIERDVLSFSGGTVHDDMAVVVIQPR